MITKINLGLAYTEDFWNQNQEKMSKQNGEALGVMNDYLNADGQIIVRERIQTPLGSELVLVLWRPDAAEAPTP